MWEVDCGLWEVWVVGGGLSFVLLRFLTQLWDVGFEIEIEIGIEIGLHQ